MKPKLSFFAAAGVLSLTILFSISNSTAAPQITAQTLTGLQQVISPKRSIVTTKIESYKKSKSDQAKKELQSAMKNFRAAISENEKSIKSQRDALKQKASAMKKASTDVKSLEIDASNFDEILEYLKAQRQEALSEFMDTVADKTKCLGHTPDIDDIYFSDFFEDWLIIRGTDCSDSFTLEEVLSHNGFTNYSVVTEIEVDLNDGSDTFSVESDSVLNKSEVAMRVYCGDGNDSITTDKTVDNIDCNRDEGNKTISTGKQADEISIDGSGTHTVDAGAGDDAIDISGSGNCTVNTGMGDDTVWENDAASCTLDTESGDDNIDVWGSGTFTIYAGSGGDTVFTFFADGAITAYLDRSTSILSGKVNASGNNDDTYDGSYDNIDTVYTSAGQDLIDVSGGADIITVQSDSAEPEISLGYDSDSDTVNLNGNENATINEQEAEDVVNP